ncbi:AAA family ATPase [Anaerostipes hadrus]|uniref:AAA family ATPase n=1 Tax=Anaerostipes hadrus TaxID=649756 RepID=UPI003A7F4DCD
MLPENFFDEQECITNVTAIVGENGAGKTTILDMLSNYQGSVKDKEYDPIYDNYFREKYECLRYHKHIFCIG